MSPRADPGRLETQVALELRAVSWRGDRRRRGLGGSAAKNTDGAQPIDAQWDRGRLSRATWVALGSQFFLTDV